MAFKICLLLITISLFEVGQSIRFFNNVNSNEKINEDTVKKIQQVFGKTYPQAAIDKYINVVRQLHSQVPEENEAGNFESLVLMVEGAFYQTEIEREMLSGNSSDYDVRSALKRIRETTQSSHSDDLTEKSIKYALKDLSQEFPTEVAEKIVSILKKILNATTLQEAKRTAVEFTVLSMDGARVITSRKQHLGNNLNQCKTTQNIS